MRNFTKKIAALLMSALCVGSASAVGEQNRGLWAGQNFVSWRMRASDDPFKTTYNLYADGELIFSSKTKTNTNVDAKYASATFSLEVLDEGGKVIDSQEGAKMHPYYYHHLALNHPGKYKLSSGEVTYIPYDCSAYDMDGDGEQEIIMCWSGGEGPDANPTAPPILDCIKLDGTLLWRINLGPNIMSGCRMTFLCYDFDGDGYGELITKTAPGAKDGKGNFLSKGVAAGANHSHLTVNSAGKITDGGPEWLTCFSGKDGAELATIDYWPYFNIRSNWDDRSGRTDGNTYGHRGNWMKGCVAFLDVNGKPKPCAVTTRGIYTYSYAAAWTWDGKTLSNHWKHTSDKAGQGIYGEGAHSITCGDVDGDGFDEIIVGAACLDHNGQLLWRTGLGHGDATHLGEFDPTNPGLEYFMITEESDSKYDCALLDAKTGKVLYSKAQTGGDTGRGLILDCDSTYDGAEMMEWSYAKLFSCKGVDIADWHTGTTNSSSINGRIFWDGDLLEEYTDRGHVDKWNMTTKTWDRMLVYGYNIMVDGQKVRWGANTNNATKYNPNLQADIVGDWREESLFWTEQNGKYYLTIYSSNIPSEYKLPWLRDDHVYDMAVAWEHCGYNQPPHLGYSPLEYYRGLVPKTVTLSAKAVGKSIVLDWKVGGIKSTDVISTQIFRKEDANPVGRGKIGANSRVYSFTDNDIEYGQEYYYWIKVTVNGQTIASDAAMAITIDPDAPAITKCGAGSSNQAVNDSTEFEAFCYSWTGLNTVEFEWNPKEPEGLDIAIDKTARKVEISGKPTGCGKYSYVVFGVANGDTVSKKGSIVFPECQSAGVESVEAQRFGVYPNPTDGEVNIKSADGAMYSGRVGVWDMMGRKVMEAEVIDGRLDLEGLSSGVYALVVDGERVMVMVK